MEQLRTERWDQAAGRPRHAYIHVPFCASKCAYCNFVSYAGRFEAVDRWAAAVQAEMAQTVQKEGPPLETVYWGGGTPSVVPEEKLIVQLAQLGKRPGLTANAEITLEANPQSGQQLDWPRLLAAGFNRLSIGLQAAQPRLLDTLGRTHTPQDFVHTVEAAAKAGFTRISTDLMLGLPGQTLDDLSESLQLILSLPIEHVSYYSLSLEAGTPFYDCYANRPEALPDEDLEREMFWLVMDRLAAAGLQPYEISNAAKPGARSRHNTAYWLGEHYYGFGPAAHAYVEHVRLANTDDLDHYIHAWLDPDGRPSEAVVERTVIDLAEARREAMMLGFRLLEGISRPRFKARFAQDPCEVFAAELAELQQRGLIEVDVERIRLSRQGIDLANQVFMAFV